jgi:hypothetical protein
MAAGVALVLICAWSLVGNFLVASAWTPPMGRLLIAKRALLAAYGACLLIHFWRNQTSSFAPVMFTALAFLLAYQGGMPYWYMAPLLPAIALARRRAEYWLWYVVPLVFPPLFFYKLPWPPVGELLWRGWFS